MGEDSITKPVCVKHVWWHTGRIRTGWGEWKCLHCGYLVWTARRGGSDTPPDAPGAIIANDRPSD